MNKALIVRDELRKLTDKNNIKSLFKDKKASIDLLIDYKSGDFSGLRILKDLDGEGIEVDTKYSLIINKDKKSDWIELDQKLKKAIESYAISNFDYEDIDEDDFKVLNKKLEKDLILTYKKESEGILNELKDEMKSIKDKNYPKDLIKTFLSKFEIIKKKNSYNLKYIGDFFYIKINTKKEFIKIKNNYSYQKKIDMNKFIKDFDLTKIVLYLENKRKKKEYNNKLMELEDSFDRESVHTSTITSDETDIDIVKKESQEKN